MILRKLPVLRRAVELGIDFIDTADSYGPHVSEEIIAEALHPYPAGLVIATKGGFDRPGPNQWVENGKPSFTSRMIGVVNYLTEPFTPKICRTENWPLDKKIT